MFETKHRPARVLVKSLAIVTSLVLAIATVEARPASGGNVGSRGAKSQSAPPPTNTAPKQAQPLPGATTQAPRAATPAAPAAPAAAPSRWNGLLGGFAGGLIGAGLIGMMFGHGFMGGMGSFMSFIGLLLQVAVVAFLVKMAIGYFRRRQAQPAMAGAAAGEGYARQAVQPDWSPASGAAQAVPASAPQVQPLVIDGPDFESFERLLGEIQDLYGRGDRIGLAQRATPEIANVFNSDLDDLGRRGLINRISGVKLLQGDLSEAWREKDAEYATVAMRYAIMDAKVERTTGRVVEGDLNNPQQVTEIWTFVRQPGGTPRDWQLSAIQQA